MKQHIKANAAVTLASPRKKVVSIRCPIPGLYKVPTGIEQLRHSGEQVLSPGGEALPAAKNEPFLRYKVPISLEGAEAKGA